LSTYAVTSEIDILRGALGANSVVSSHKATSVSRDGQAVVKMLVLRPPGPRNRRSILRLSAQVHE